MFLELKFLRTKHVFRLTFYSKRKAIRLHEIFNLNNFFPQQSIEEKFWRFFWELSSKLYIICEITFKQVLLCKYKEYKSVSPIFVSVFRFLSLLSWEEVFAFLLLQGLELFPESGLAHHHAAGRRLHLGHGANGWRTRYLKQPKWNIC